MLSQFSFALRTFTQVVLDYQLFSSSHIAGKSVKNQAELCGFEKEKERKILAEKSCTGNYQSAFN